MADTIREDRNASEAVRTRRRRPEKVRKGPTVAEAADAAKSVSQAAKDAGQKLKDKAGPDLIVLPLYNGRPNWGRPLVFRPSGIGPLIQGGDR